MSELLFEVRTPIGSVIRTTVEYWNYLVTVKHPIMKGREETVKATLADPIEVRRSKSDDSVFLYYGMDDRKYCVIAKHDGNAGFLVTAYPVDKVKEGEVVWIK